MYFTSSSKVLKKLLMLFPYAHIQRMHSPSLSKANVMCPFCSTAAQHDTCPVCRKSLNGEDSNSQVPPESPSLSTDPRTQERWSFWDAPPLSPRLHPSNTRPDQTHLAFLLSSLAESSSSQSYCFGVFVVSFLFTCLSLQPCTQLSKSHPWWLHLLFSFMSIYIPAILDWWWPRLCLLYDLLSPSSPWQIPSFTKCTAETHYWHRTPDFVVLHPALLKLANSCSWAPDGV